MEAIEEVCIKKYKRSLAEGQESDDVYVTIGDSPTADMAVNQEVWRDHSFADEVR